MATSTATFPPAKISKASRPRRPRRRTPDILPPEQVEQDNVDTTPQSPLPPTTAARSPAPTTSTSSSAAPTPISDTEKTIATTTSSAENKDSSDTIKQEIYSYAKQNSNTWFRPEEKREQQVDEALKDIYHLTDKELLTLTDETKRSEKINRTKIEKLFDQFTSKKKKKHVDEVIKRANQYLKAKLQEHQNQIGVKMTKAPTTEQKSDEPITESKTEAKTEITTSQSSSAPTTSTSPSLTPTPSSDAATSSSSTTTAAAAATSSAEHSTTVSTSTVSTSTTTTIPSTVDSKEQTNTAATQSSSTSTTTSSSPSLAHTAASATATTAATSTTTVATASGNSSAPPSSPMTAASSTSTSMKRSSTAAMLSTTSTSISTTTTTITPSTSLTLEDKTEKKRSCFEKCKQPISVKKLREVCQEALRQTDEMKQLLGEITNFPVDTLTQRKFNIYPIPTAGYDSVELRLWAIHTRISIQEHLLAEARLTENIDITSYLRQMQTSRTALTALKTSLLESERPTYFKTIEREIIDAVNLPFKLLQETINDQKALITNKASGSKFIFELSKVLKDTTPAQLTTERELITLSDAITALLKKRPKEKLQLPESKKVYEAAERFVQTTNPTTKQSNEIKLSSHSLTRPSDDIQHACYLLNNLKTTIGQHKALTDRTSKTGFSAFIADLQDILKDVHPNQLTKHELQDQASKINGLIEKRTNQSLRRLESQQVYALAKAFVEKINPQENKSFLTNRVS